MPALQSASDAPMRLSGGSVSLIKCSECDHDVSDRAAACPNCGFLVAKSDDQNSGLASAWQAVTKSRTPINVFALAMMACAAILGASAIHIDNVCALTAFTHTLHVFLAVSGMFFVTILFCRKGIYHPEDLAKAKRFGADDMGSDRPMAAALLIGVMMAGYAFYQWWVVAETNDAGGLQPADCKLQEEPPKQEALLLEPPLLLYDRRRS